MGFLPQVLYPNDIRAMQDHLRADVEGTNETVKSCPAVDDATRTSWNSFYNLVLGYCTVTVDGAGIDYTTSLLAPLWYGPTLRDLFGSSTAEFYNRGRSLESSLIDWQTKLSTAPYNCPLKSPLHNKPPDEPESSALTALKWGTIAIVAVAGAYAVSKVVPIAADGVKAISTEFKKYGPK